MTSLFCLITFFVTSVTWDCFLRVCSMKDCGGAARENPQHEAGSLDQPGDAGYVVDRDLPSHQEAGAGVAAASRGRRGGERRIVPAKDRATRDARAKWAASRRSTSDV